MRRFVCRFNFNAPLPNLWKLAAIQVKRNQKAREKQRKKLKKGKKKRVALCGQSYEADSDCPLIIGGRKEKSSRFGSGPFYVYVESFKKFSLKSPAVTTTDLKAPFDILLRLTHIFPSSSGP